MSDETLKQANEIKEQILRLELRLSLLDKNNQKIVGISCHFLTGSLTPSKMVYDFEKDKELECFELIRELLKSEMNGKLERLRKQFNEL